MSRFRVWDPVESGRDGGEVVEAADAEGAAELFLAQLAKSGPLQSPGYELRVLDEATSELVTVVVTVEWGPTFHGMVMQ